VRNQMNTQTAPSAGIAIEQQGGSMTKEQMLARIKLLSGEIDANEDENRQMQAEIDSLYARIDALQ
jgi:hypothetical protein